MERTQDLVRSRVGPAITRARWIWGREDPRPLNAYRLSINGVIVAAGPAPSRPEQRLYDRVSIVPHIRRGANCIAVEVSCPGLMTGTTIGYRQLLEDCQR